MEPGWWPVVIHEGVIICRECSRPTTHGNDISYHVLLLNGQIAVDSAPCVWGVCFRGVSALFELCTVNILRFASDLDYEANALSCIRRRTALSGVLVSEMGYGYLWRLSGH